ncbi:hypothetical protein CFIMG_002843RAa [Ceratocystis fimbriata CBS 114723]|uniref:Uncharacterized protein n=1 Tax=Ceratocystis fimbriata CBS 114723 TaxID=1035309 RepID=A0A2C5X8U3_9PEZI|nr:hypothetical protein CFIMG_002843RAa [Ceratocystis fimbriata CBS 114723]
MDPASLKRRASSRQSWLRQKQISAMSIVKRSIPRSSPSSGNLPGTRMSPLLLPAVAYRPEQAFESFQLSSSPISSTLCLLGQKENVDANYDAPKTIENPRQDENGNSQVTRALNSTNVWSPTPSTRLRASLPPPSLKKSSTSPNRISPRRRPEPIFIPRQDQTDCMDSYALTTICRTDYAEAESHTSPPKRSSRIDGGAAQQADASGSFASTQDDNGKGKANLPTQLISLSKSADISHMAQSPQPQIANLTSGAYFSDHPPSPPAFEPTSLMHQPEPLSQSDSCATSDIPVLPMDHAHVCCRCAVAHTPPQSLALRSRPQMLLLGGMAYDCSEIRLMASEILACRSSGELPFSTAPLTDPKIIVEDWGILQILRLSRGNPNKKPSPDYERLRTEIKKLFTERDSDRSDEAARNAAKERIRFFLSAAAKEGSELHEILNRCENTPETYNNSTANQRSASLNIPTESWMASHHSEASVPPTSQSFRRKSQPPMGTPAPLTAHLPASAWTPHHAVPSYDSLRSGVPLTAEIQSIIKETVRDTMNEAMQPIQELREYIASVRDEMSQLVQTQLLTTDRLESMHGSVEVLAEVANAIPMQLEKALGDVQAAQCEGVEGLRLEQLHLQEEMVGSIDEAADAIAVDVEQRVRQGLEAQMSMWFSQLEEIHH